MALAASVLAGALGAAPADADTDDCRLKPGLLEAPGTPHLPHLPPLDTGGPWSEAPRPRGHGLYCGHIWGLLLANMTIMLGRRQDSDLPVSPWVLWR